KIIQQQEKIKELRRLRKENPEKFKQYLKEHPEFRRHFEDLKDRREDNYDRHDRSLEQVNKTGVRDYGQGIGKGKGQGSMHNDKKNYEQRAYQQQRKRAD
ncbi:MAG: hypothetical protein ABIH27_02625, partial [Candidatus Omnitrophota bacterium]